jgi:structural maintenance of chromosome 4
VPSDDDEEEEEADPQVKENEQDEDDVKEELSQPSKKKEREGTPANDFHTYNTDDLAKFRKQALVADAELLDGEISEQTDQHLLTSAWRIEKIKNAKPDLSVLKEYRKREAEFLNRAKDLENITNQRDQQKQTYDGLRKQRLDEFMAGFNLISLKLKEMYQVCSIYRTFDGSIYLHVVPRWLLLVAMLNLS